MHSKKGLIGILVLVAMLFLSCVAVSNVAGSRAVDYTKNLTDPSGDVTGNNAVGDFRDDADITAVKSSASDGIITLKMTVVGVIHLDDGSIYQAYYYYFYIDVNMDGSEDWKVSVANYFMSS